MSSIYIQIYMELTGEQKHHQIYEVGNYPYHDGNTDGISTVSSIYIWSKNLVAKSEAKDGGN